MNFIILSTEDSIDISSAQFKFLINDLENTKNDHDVDWIIVGLHKPIYSDGKHTTVRGPSNIIDLEHMIWIRTLIVFWGGIRNV